MRTSLALGLGVIFAYLACFNSVHAGSASIRITIVAAIDRDTLAAEAAVARVIATKLANEARLASRHLTVMVRDGVVMLEGRVMDEAERLLAAHVALEACSGYTISLVNRIVALSDFMPTTLARNRGDVTY